MPKKYQWNRLRQTSKQLKVGRKCPDKSSESLKKGALLMSEEKKQACRSFADGHHMHYIAVNSASRPRVPASIKMYGGAAFLVTVEGESALWFTHDPLRLRIALAGAKPENVEATKGRSWLFVKGDYSVECFNMSTKPVTPCVRG